MGNSPRNRSRRTINADIYYSLKKNLDQLNELDAKYLTGSIPRNEYLRQRNQLKKRYERLKQIHKINQ